MNTTAYDTEWFDTYINKCSFDDINYIKFDQDNLAKQRELFFAGKIDEPSLLYNDNRECISGFKEELKIFQDSVEKDKYQMRAVRQAYLRKISEQFEKLELLEAMYNSEDVKISQISSNLYGELDEDLFRVALSSILYASREKKVAVEHGVDELITYFNVVPDRRAFNYVSLEDREILCVEDLVEMFEDALKKRDIPWNVKICNEALSIHLNYQNETIYIPSNRGVNMIEARAVIEHEIGVHLTRCMNGRQKKLMLLSIGLDHYIKGEEGVTTYKQVTIDRSSLPGVIYYLAIGLASGMYKNDPWNFRQIYDLAKEYFRIFTDNENLVEDRAWKTCLRVFRGTTGKVGNYFVRDSVYLTGYMQIKDLVDNDSPEVDRFFVGKYDPVNSDHTNLLDELGIR